MKQKGEYFKIYERIANKVDDWLTDLKGAEDDKLLEALDMFRQFRNAVAFQCKTNKMQRQSDMNKVYKVLEDILKDLEFDEAEIEELMSIAKTLDKEQLKKLLRVLAKEFYRASADIEEYLEELEEYSEEELEALNE